MLKSASANIKYTALYGRLSHDDELKGDSNSIVHQKEILLRYAEERGFANPRFFVDDGVSGVTFQRTGFQEMLAEIEAGNISTVIVKDMSRFGRNYLQVGMYTECLFPEKGVRFIAINDGVDSENGTDNDFTPFRNIINEWYAKDCSKKIRAVKKSPAQQGKVFSARAPYGYVNSKDNRQVWEIDEEAAELVREIFRRYIAGDGTYVIALDFNKRGIDSPLTHSKKISGKEYDKDLYWGGYVINTLLSNRAYLGELITQKYTSASYKVHKRIIRPESDWCVFPGHHEAIIDIDTFETAQQLLGKRRRPNKVNDGIIPPLNGLFRCADCGSSLNLARDNYKKNQYYICRNYRSFGSTYYGSCTRHSLNRGTIEALVLENLKKVISFAKADRNNFIKIVRGSSDKAIEKVLKTKQTELDKAERRIAELDTIITRIYEDHVVGKLSEERFSKMLAGYEVEQAGLVRGTAALKAEVQATKEKTANADKFLRLVDRFDNIEELTPELARTFIEKIVVYEATYSQEKKRKKTSQKIEIHYTCIGEFETENQ